MKKGFESRAAAMNNARRFFNASESRIGRVKRQVRRAFITEERPLTTGELLPRCFPRLKRFQDWHRWSVRRALLQVARKIGRSDRSRGRPFLWCPHDVRLIEGTTESKSSRDLCAAIEAFAKARGYVLVAEFYDEAVKGGDDVNERPGFKAMLDRIAGNGVRVVIVESPDRFARDLIVQMTGHDYLRRAGVQLIPTTAPDFFAEDTPTAVLIRQVLGAVAQFEKASLVAKLKAARDRKRERTGKCGGRKSYAEIRPETVSMAKRLHGERVSYRNISKALKDAGHTTSTGNAYAASAIQVMLA